MPSDKASDQSSGRTELNWWQGLLASVFVFASAVWVIYGEGIQSPLSLGMIPIGLFAAYGIYDAIEDYRSQSKEVPEAGALSSKQGTKSKLRSFVEGWQARDRSVSAVIYTWFTVGFTIIFLLPPSEWWVPVRLLVLTLAGGMIWVRTGGEGPAETTKERMKRFGAGVAGVLSGLVIALSVQWLFAQFL